jgi:hypothetical protein
MKVEEVHFNHDPSSASSDALTIRENGSPGTLIQAPEWRAGLAAKPAAYAAQALGSQVTIKARFSGGPPKGKVRIRAIDAWVPPASPGGCLGWLVVLIAQILRALFGNVLGDVRKEWVTFDAAGNSPLVTFRLIHHKLKTSGVGVHSTAWKWQWKQGSPWTDFDATSHKVYLVLGLPAGPWVQTAADDTQLPWASALETACSWALGAMTPDEAAARVTRAVNTQPLVSYVPATMFGFSSYLLTSYLAAINGSAPFVMNCTDSADAVTTLSNLLGCDLWEGRFFNMQTRKFLTLSGNPANLADWVSWSWGYHEICWLSAIALAGLVYDGCLQLDMDDDDSDAVHVAQHPIKMPFDQGGPDDYKPRLIASGTGNLENVPRRRAVV